MGTTTNLVIEIHASSLVSGLIETARRRCNSPVQVIVVGYEYLACLGDVPDLGKGVSKWSKSRSGCLLGYLYVFIVDLGGLQKLHRLPLEENLTM